MDILEKVHELASKGFLCEVCTDGWANWDFKDGKPDYSTCTPSTLNLKHFDDVSTVCFRGNFWYFTKSNELVRDDIGCYSIKDGGAKRAYESLFETYEHLKDEINPNGFKV